MTDTYYLEFPPFSRDGISILTAQEWAEDLPANYHYEAVQVGDGGEYPTLSALEDWVAEENERRRS